MPTSKSKLWRSLPVQTQRREGRWCCASLILHVVASFPLRLVWVWSSPVTRCSYPEGYHPCVISCIALLCDSVGWTADVERISAWLNGLGRETYELVFAAIEVPEEECPALGRPLVDTVRGSRHKNMKELRPGSRGRSEVRILFAFDPARQAIMLAAGNKAGRWTQWYDEKIKAADEMFAEHLARFEDTKPKKRKRKKG